MRIAVYPADHGGCGHYRLIWPAEQVQAAGHDVTIIPQGDPESRIMAVLQDRTEIHPNTGVPYTTANVVGIAETPEYDVVVLQRPLSKLLAQLVPHLKAAGVAVVVELDDDFLRLDPQNVAWQPVHPRLNPENNYLWLQEAARQADLITVSTPALRDVYRTVGKPDPVILPNCLPHHAYSDGLHSLDHEGMVVGWSGSLAVHPDDLREQGNAIARLSRCEGYAGFHVVGTGDGVRSQLGVPDDGRFGAAGKWLPLDEYHEALDAIDVGIVPLKPTRFNEGKSWLKGLEFAARGIPAVCTPTGPYRDLAGLQGCLLADSPKAWYRTLSHVIADRAYWQDLSAQVWETAWSLRIGAHAHLWAEAWTLARAERLVNA